MMQFPALFSTYPGNKSRYKDDMNVEELGVGNVSATLKTTFPRERPYTTGGPGAETRLHSTSSPGSLILPPPLLARSLAPGGGTMRDPGNDVELHGCAHHCRNVRGLGESMVVQMKDQLNLRVFTTNRSIWRRKINGKMVVYQM